MRKIMQLIGLAGWLFVAVSLFSGCYNAAEERRKSTIKLAHAMAQLGYSYHAAGKSYSDLTNEVNKIMRP